MSDMNNYGTNDQQNYGTQGGDYSQQSYGYTGAPVQEEKKGLSIASLVLGICGFIAWCIPLIGYPVTIVGIICGVLGMKKGGRTMAIVGIVLSGITLFLTLGNSILGAYIAASGALNGLTY
ncbi:MAG: DUF4190 domain-containing protein [Blautia sp.]|nr:DUF4190 domain-containing protein [Blautia sp.]